MLSIHFTNKSNLAPVSEYEVDVEVNGELIWMGHIIGHRRADGWKMLVRKFAQQLEED